MHRGFADRSLTTWVRRLKLRALKFWLKRPALLRETLSVPLSYLDITAFIQVYTTGACMALARYDNRLGSSTGRRRRSVRIDAA